MQTPAAVEITFDPETEQIEGVAELRTTVRPELALAVIGPVGELTPNPEPVVEFDGEPVPAFDEPSTVVPGTLSEIVCEFCTLKLCVTGTAAVEPDPPSWLAVIEHVPMAENVAVEPL